MKHSRLTADDRILPTIRILAIFVIPFLVVASVILYVWPGETGRLFAWPIKPPMTAMMLAAAYIGGIYYFARVAAARSWHTIKGGMLPVTTFATLLGIATIMHWDRFTHGHVAFITWAGLYFTTPFLVSAAWLSNRRADPGVPEPDDLLLPVLGRWLMGAAGAITLAISLFLFFRPTLMVAVWPWTLSSLTARVVGAMFALPGILGLELALDRRWSVARVMLEAQTLSLFAILVAILRAWSDFNKAYLGTWLIVGGFFGLFLGLVALYLSVEAARTRQAAGQPVEKQPSYNVQPR